MKKRIISYVILLTSILFFLTACGNKMNGTYKSESFPYATYSSGIMMVSMEVKIHNEQVTATLKPLLSYSLEEEEEEEKDYSTLEETIEGTINSEEQSFEFDNGETLNYLYDEEKLTLHLEDGTKIVLYKE